VYVQLCADDMLQLARSHSANDIDDSNIVSTWMEDKLRLAAILLFSYYKHLQWIAVTNGLLPAVLFSRADYVQLETGIEQQQGYLTQFHRYHASFMEPAQSESGSITASLITALIAGSSMVDAFQVGLAALNTTVAEANSDSNSGSSDSINGSSSDTSGSGFASDSVRAVRHEVVKCK
jgi:hypothetical protein